MQQLIFNSRKSPEVPTERRREKHPQQTISTILPMINNIYKIVPQFQSFPHSICRQCPLLVLVIIYRYFASTSVWTKEKKIVCFHFVLFCLLNRKKKMEKLHEWNWCAYCLLCDELILALRHHSRRQLVISFILHEFTQRQHAFMFALFKSTIYSSILSMNYRQPIK